jgi:N-methylhydantoinase A
MSVGSTVDGPAIITEDETTVIVPANRKAISQSDGSIEMRLKVIQE